MIGRISLSDYFHLLDDYGGDGNVLEVAVASGVDACDLVDYLDAACNLTECGILTVEMGSVLVHDEELGGC